MGFETGTGRQNQGSNLKHHWHRRRSSSEPVRLPAPRESDLNRAWSRLAVPLVPSAFSRRPNIGSKPVVNRSAGVQIRLRCPTPPSCMASGARSSVEIAKNIELETNSDSPAVVRPELRPRPGKVAGDQITHMIRAFSAGSLSWFSKWSMPSEPCQTNTEKRHGSGRGLSQPEPCLAFTPWRFLPPRSPS